VGQDQDRQKFYYVSSIYLIFRAALNSYVDAQKSCRLLHYTT